ncbi:MAG: hypothetical protein JKY65_29790 [Planctomycetes bacterium]|nr:hypothetical protein [Planctomycetota bacterium]
MQQLIWVSLLGLLSLGSVQAEEIKLKDGRVYQGKAIKKGKRTRIEAAKRWIDVPTARLGEPAQAPARRPAPDTKHWLARLGTLQASAALAKDDALVELARVERTELVPRSCQALKVVFPLGTGAPLPGDTAGIRAELERFRIARRYGHFLSPGDLKALDPALVAQAEALVRDLLAARSKGAPLDEVLARVPALKLPYKTWEALVRGGAGSAWGKEPAPTQAIPLTLPGGKKSAYLLQVPKGHRASVPAPVIVALHGQGDGLRSMLACWGRFAQKQGMLLMSVEYAVTRAQGYHHSYLEHSTVLTALLDLSNRYAVDFDRVFLTGHSMGGHASWDTAFSHPDRFAGVIPLISSHFAFDKHYRRNARRVPVYCIQGEKDVWTERCRKQTKAMIDLGADVTYVEYIGRGHEGFYEELPWVAPWMAARSRDPYPKRFELVAGRLTDFRRFWVRIDEVKIRLFDLAPTSKVSKRVVATVQARVLPNNTLRVDCKAATALTIFLSDRLLDLDKRVRLRVNRKVRFKETVKRSASFMLRDFVQRGDRETLYATAVELEGL